MAKIYNYPSLPEISYFIPLYSQSPLQMIFKEGDGSNYKSRWLQKHVQAPSCELIQKSLDVG